MSAIFLEKSRKFYLASCLYDCIEDNDIKALEKLLCEKCADPNVLLPERGISPFHLAVGIDSEQTAEEIVRLFLRYNGNPNVRSEDNLTPVHIAAAWGRKNILDVLLRCGGDPGFRDDDYMTALDYAYEEGHMDIVTSLRRLREELMNDGGRVDGDVYNISLDKVIVSAGAIVAEYGVNNTDNPDNSLTYNLCNALRPLPKSIVNSYVQNWCIKHAEIVDGQEPACNRQGSDVYKDSGCKISDVDKKTSSVAGNRDDSSSGSGNSEREDDDEDYVVDSARKQIKYYSKTLNRRLIINVQDKSEESSNDEIVLSDDSVQQKDSSKESGILTISSGSLSNNSPDVLNECAYIKSSSVDTLDSKPNSDYVTCDESVLNKNIYDYNSVITSDNTIEITEDNSDIHNVNLNYTDITETRNDLPKSDDDTFFSIAEEYKYVDDHEGIVLIEKRLLVNPKIDDKSSTSSKVSSLPTTIEYDTDTLRQELTHRGEEPGPITRTTKRVYLKKLMRLKQLPEEAVPATRTAERVYSVELEKTLRNPAWSSDLTLYKHLERVVVQQFSNPDPTKWWREGVSKTSFTYLLLDPRVTSNLPARSEKIPVEETWKTFLSSIFYVGKGKRSRPYSHLYEAVAHWNKGVRTHPNKKIQKILNIWQDAHGVVCLHVYQNVIPVEAYTREAAMISAMKLQNLDNVKLGDFYGLAATWPERQKRLFGVYLLHRAMLIFLIEGERQLRPDDIDK